jgi:hypothetical protein
MNRIYFRRAACPKIPGAAPRAAHGALTTQPNAYERGVDFLDRALLPPRRRR